MEISPYVNMRATQYRRLERYVCNVITLFRFFDGIGRFYFVQIPGIVFGVICKYVISRNKIILNKSGLKDEGHLGSHQAYGFRDGIISSCYYLDSARE